MTLRIPTCVALVLALSAVSARRSGAETAPVGDAVPGADVILRGGTIYTGTTTHPVADAVALAGGRILAVGDDATLARYVDSATRIVELDGRMVLPGLHDSHVHPMSAGVWFVRCRLDDAKTPAALGSAVEACAKRPASGDWFVARGLDDAMFPRGERAAIFDRIEWPQPAALSSARGDRHWLDPRATALLGLAAPDDAAVAAGIERDANGRPTGFVHGAASAQARAKLPQPSEREYRAALRHVTARLNARGITAVTDASVSAPMLGAYRSAERAGELTVRVRLAQRYDLSVGTSQIAALVARRDSLGSPMLRADAVKLFVDGDLPERGAALLEPYADGATRGELYFPPAALDDTVAALDAAGFDLHVHAMGDRAVRGTLDAIERAIAANAPRERRHQLAHVFLVDRAELPRFGALGVIANVQLAWAKPDGDNDTALQRLGPARARRTLAFADLVSHGAMLVAGSDGPLGGADPFASMEIGATRRAPDGRGDALQPAQVLAVSRLLEAMTRNGAYAARAERFSGSLTPGHAADLVVVDRNLLAIDPATIGETRVLLTLLEGRAVHVEPGFDWPP
ncbi:MAG TPA: amidohydrolase [Candidatus Saccharimonadia bacterium]|nr:amidohydrolase [Candidatus Saccharimonadia bacterium]